jgi:hypothetical protein
MWQLPQCAVAKRPVGRDLRFLPALTQHPGLRDKVMTID